MNDQMKRVEDALANPEAKLWCHFVGYALKPLNAFNVALQTSSSKIGTMQRDIFQLLRQYLTNFIRPECLTGVSEDDIDRFDFWDAEMEVPNSELGIGTATRLLLEEEADSMEGTQQEAAFFTTVRAFYREAVSKMVSKFPFRDTTIRDLSLLDPSSRSKTTSTSVTRLAKRFLRLSTEDMDDLHREFLDYKSMPEDQLPPVDASSPSAIDHFWSAIASMPAPGDAEQHRFTHLAELCKVLLVLPHSTADPERLFSMIRKIETDHRGSLLPATVCSLLHVKLNTDQECFRSEALFCPDLLKAARTATDRSNVRSSSE